MPNNLIACEESSIKNSTKLKWEERSNKSKRKDRGKDCRWWEPIGRQNKESAYKDKNKSACKLNSEEICFRNSQERISLNSSPSKSEGWRNKSTRDKSRGYGSKDYRPIDLRNKDSKSNIQRLWRINVGNKNKSKNKSKDC